MRFGDLRLQYVGVAPETWLDKHETNLLTQQKKEEKFDEKEKDLRRKATEKGRAQVPNLVKQCFDAGLSKLPYDPYDIKALWHPIDFVIFNGLNEKKDVDDIIFLSRMTKDTQLNEVRKTVKETVEKEKYDWKIARVTDKGVITLEDK
jgi:predicted Holliday junction resolvase-like endonuclease